MFGFVFGFVNRTLEYHEKRPSRINSSTMSLYHALNRGVDKRVIFLDNQDHARFVHDMYEFNDTAPAQNTYRGSREMFGLRNQTFTGRERERIVDIHGWCLMKNHYHLLLSERLEGGISLFLRKLNVGYANYFNERYKRSGTLFQGRTKKIRIVSEPHFLYILHYIHLNPLDFLKESKSWRSMRIPSVKRAQKHLTQYRWSSFADYCGRRNFPSILTTDLFKELFKNYEKEITEYLQDMELSGIKPYLLE